MPIRTAQDLCTNKHSTNKVCTKRRWSHDAARTVKASMPDLTARTTARGDAGRKSVSFFEAPLTPLKKRVECLFFSQSNFCTFFRTELVYFLCPPPVTSASVRVQCSVT